MIFIALYGNSASTILNLDGIAIAMYNKDDFRRANSDSTLGGNDFVVIGSHFMQI